RAGNAGSARGAASLVAEAIATTKAVLAAQPATPATASTTATAAPEIVVRADSAFYSRTVITACRRAGVRFSITVRVDAKGRRATATSDEEGWVEIRYPQRVGEEEQRGFIPRAKTAKPGSPAFEGTRHEVTARLIVRRVPDLNKSTVDGQGALFTV